VSTSPPIPSRSARLGLLGRTAFCGALAGACLFAAGAAQALPQLLDSNPQYSSDGFGPSISQPDSQHQNVTLNASRTIIDYTAYDISPGETVTYYFNNRSDIVLNRLDSTSPATINGLLQAFAGGTTAVPGGNVWITAPGGLVFGANALVNVGGLLATTATLNNTDVFLSPAGTTFAFGGTINGGGGSDVINTPGGAGGISLLDGAQINANGGLVAFIAPFVNAGAGSRVNTGTTTPGQLLVAGALDLTLTLVQTQAGDLDLVSYTLDPTVVATPLELDGVMAGKDITITALADSTLTSAVVNAKGTFIAIGAQPGQDGGVSLYSADPFTPNSVAAPTAILGGGSIQATGGVSVIGNSDLALGAIAGRGVVASAAGALTTGAIDGGGAGVSVIGGGAMSLGAITGSNVTLSAAGAITAGAIDAGAGAAYVSAYGPASLQSIAGADIAIYADSLSVGRMSSQNSILIEMPSGAVSIGSLQTPGEADIYASSLSLNSATIGGPAIFSASSVTVGSATIAGAATISGTSVNLGNLALGGGGAITGASVNVGTLAAGGGVAISATPGAVPISPPVSQQPLSGGQGGQAASSASVSVGSVQSAGDITLTGSTVSVQSASAGGGVTITGDALSLGSVTATRDINLQATGGVAASAGLSAGRNLDVQAVGAVDLAGITASGSATLSGASVSTQGTSVGAGLTATAANGDATIGDVTGSGVIRITANGAAALHGATLQTGSIQLTAQGANGDVVLGQGTGVVSGASTIQLAADRDVLVSVAGALTLGSVQAGRDASLSAGQLSLGALSATRDVTLQSTAGDLVNSSNLSAGRDLTVSAKGAVTLADLTAPGSISLTSGGDLTAGAVNAGLDVGATAGGRALLTSVTAAGDVLISAASARVDTLSAGRNLAIETGALQLGTASAAGEARIVATSFDLTGGLTAPTVDIESATGPLQVGGASPAASGLTLTADAVSRIHAAAALDLYAGPTSGTARGDLVVQDVAFDPALTPVVNLYAGPQNAILVHGIAAPTVSGGALSLGSGSDPNWRPASIYITGGLGAATRVNDREFTNVRAFDSVSLNASGDILMGSQRFIDLVAATPASSIDIAMGRPNGVAATAGETGREFLVTGRLFAATNGKLVQQNTAAEPGDFAGIYLTNARPGQPLGAVLTIDPPSVVDLFGSYLDTTGKVQASLPAARGPDLVVVGLAPGEPVPSDFHFNGCPVSQTAACQVAGAQQTLRADDVVAAVAAGDTAASAEANSGRRIAAPPPIAAVAQADEDDPQSDPVVTGAGNEEIWRQAAGRQP
jgi:filamentous hemagglutinin